MSDQQQHQAPEVDTPDPQGEQQHPVVDWEADDNPYVTRYREAQAWGTRTAQENAELRRTLDALKSDDPDTRAEAARALGYEFVTDEDPTHAPDPVESLRAELEGLKQAQAQREQQAQQEQQMQALQQYIDGQLDGIDGLDQADREWVTIRALNKPPREDGLPDLHAAYAELQARDEAAQRRWAESKRTQRVSPVGQAGAQAPDLTDPVQRQQWMLERAAALEQ